MKIRDSRCGDHQRSIRGTTNQTCDPRDIFSQYYSASLFSLDVYQDLTLGFLHVVRSIQYDSNLGKWKDGPGVSSVKRNLTS